MKKIITLMITLVLCASLCACGTKAGLKNYETTSGLIAITGQSNLYYDSNTKIVYFIFNEYLSYQAIAICHHIMRLMASHIVMMQIIRH